MRLTKSSRPLAGLTFLLLTILLGCTVNPAANRGGTPEVSETTNGLGQHPALPGATQSEAPVTPDSSGSSVHQTPSHYVWNHEEGPDTAAYAAVLADNEYVIYLRWGGSQIRLATEAIEAWSRVPLVVGSHQSGNVAVISQYEGTAGVRLTIWDRTGQKRLSKQGRYLGAAWDQTGTQLAVLSSTEGSSGDNGGLPILTILHMDGTQRTIPTADHLLRIVGWSLDGGTVYATRAGTDVPLPDLIAISVAHGQSVDLVTNKAGGPLAVDFTLCRDGQGLRIAYALVPSWNRFDGYQTPKEFGIRSIETGGGDGRDLIRLPGKPFSFACSESGRTLAFVDQEGVWSVSASGEPVLLAPARQLGWGIAQVTDEGVVWVHHLRAGMRKLVVGQEGSLPLIPI